MCVVFFVVICVCVCCVRLDFCDLMVFPTSVCLFVSWGSIIYVVAVVVLFCFRYSVWLLLLVVCLSIVVFCVCKVLLLLFIDECLKLSFMCDVQFMIACLLTCVL